MKQSGIAKKRHPLLAGAEPLSFGEDFDATLLSDDQKVDQFLTKYMDMVHPFSTYSEYFKGSGKIESIIIRDIKIKYKDLVLSGRWSERKYVEVINSVFESKVGITPGSLDYAGRQFDQGQLPSQIRSRRRTPNRSTKN